MSMQFIDRLLRCSDCHGEFIFTAGEQLFFQDKQFKNDPKRCKPCKSRRSGLAAVANGMGPAAAGLSRTETRTTCSECHVETTVPFKPTQGRPVLCRQCFQAKGLAAALPLAAVAMAPAAPLAPLPLAAASAPSAATISALTSMSTRADGAMMCAEAAILAASCMASASAESSVASAADLLSISGGPVEVETTPELVPAEMLAAANVVSVPVGLVAVMAELVDA